MGSVVGTTVTYDVTALVRGVVDGQYGSSRYTRVALIDQDGSSRDSYREFATPTDASAAARPSLTVTYAGSGSGGTALPNFSRVFTIVMENEEATSIIGNPSAPFINRLAAENGLATNYTGVAHPSLPNYMALTGGQTVFTSDCQGCTTSAANIVDEVYLSGRHWKTFMDGMPSPCDTIDSGTYAQKHNPFVHYTDIVTNSHRCTTKNVPFADFDYDLRTNTLPDYVWITPDMCHDMHDCSIQVGDTWLSQIVPEILSSPAFKDAVLFITWDEGTTTSGGGGRVPLIVVSSHTPPGTKVAAPYNHFNLLATIEEAWGLPASRTDGGHRAHAGILQAIAGLRLPRVSRLTAVILHARPEQPSLVAQRQRVYVGQGAFCHPRLLVALQKIQIDADPRGPWRGWSQGQAVTNAVAASKAAGEARRHEQTQRSMTFRGTGEVCRTRGQIESLQCPSKREGLGWDEKERYATPGEQRRSFVREGPCVRQVWHSRWRFWSRFRFTPKSRVRAISAADRGRPPGRSTRSPTSRASRSGRRR